jgi:flagellar biosynthesis GTPase FlhF
LRSDYKEAVIPENRRTAYENLLKRYPILEPPDKDADFAERLERLGAFAQVRGRPPTRSGATDNEDEDTDDAEEDDNDDDEEKEDEERFAEDDDEEEEKEEEKEEEEEEEEEEDGSDRKAFKYGTLFHPTKLQSGKGWHGERRATSLIRGPFDEVSHIEPP